MQKFLNDTNTSLYEHQLEYAAKWLSCNGELWGVGPTVLFASAAAVFLYNELESSLIIPGDNAGIPAMEKTLLTTMVLGLLALMVHVWVCSTRFFQYYLDTVIRESPNVFLEMTTAGILGQSELVILGPLTRFLKQQQPQIHITLCWFLSLCYADYVRKHYCQRFNMPYLEQWQSELQARVSRAVRSTMVRAQSFVNAVQTRLRGFAQSASAYSSETRVGEPRTELPSRRKTWSNVCVGSYSIGSFTCPRMEERRHSTSSLLRQRPSEFWWQLAGKSSETSVAFAKLKAYVQATRCACVTANYQTETKSPAPEIIKVEREMVIQIVSKDISTKDSKDAANNRESEKGSIQNSANGSKETDFNEKYLNYADNNNFTEEADTQTSAKNRNDSEKTSAPEKVQEIILKNVANNILAQQDDTETTEKVATDAENKNSSETSSSKNNG